MKKAVLSPLALSAMIMANAGSSATIMDGGDGEAKYRRKSNDRRFNVPPRSQTPEEEKYYAEHKTLDGLYPRRKTA